VTEKDAQLIASAIIAWHSAGDLKGYMGYLEFQLEKDPNDKESRHAHNLIVEYWDFIEKFQEDYLIETVVAEIREQLRG